MGQSLSVLPRCFAVADNGFPFDLTLAAMLLLAGTLLGSLTIEDDGESLFLRYGPLPLLHRRIWYADVANVETDQISILDGWGILWLPYRGWTYNLRGRDCLKLTLRDNKVVRIGSEDVQSLECEVKTGTVQEALRQYEAA